MKTDHNSTPSDFPSYLKKFKLFPWLSGHQMPYSPVTLFFSFPITLPCAVLHRPGGLLAGLGATLAVLLGMPLPQSEEAPAFISFRSLLKCYLTDSKTLPSFSSSLIPNPCFFSSEHLSLTLSIYIYTYNQIYVIIYLTLYI